MNLASLLSAYYSHGNTMDWVIHSLLNAAIHAVIYSFIFRLMHHLTLGQAALLVVVVIGGLILWARARDRGRWY